MKNLFRNLKDVAMFASFLESLAINAAKERVSIVFMYDGYGILVRDALRPRNVFFEMTFESFDGEQDAFKISYTTNINQTTTLEMGNNISLLEYLSSSADFLMQRESYLPRIMNEAYLDVKNKFEGVTEGLLEYSSPDAKPIYLIEGDNSFDFAYDKTKRELKIKFVGRSVYPVFEPEHFRPINLNSISVAKDAGQRVMRVLSGVDLVGGGVTLGVNEVLSSSSSRSLWF